MAVVYALRSGNSNRYKIGRSNQTVAERKKNLATGNPDYLTEVERLDTDFDQSKLGEGYLKKRLRSKRHVAGGKEWYELSAEELADAFAEARGYLATFPPLEEEVNRLATTDTENRSVVPGDKEHALQRRLLELREEEDMLRIERRLVEMELKLCIRNC